ncbi:hypothetical protein ON010_g14279 [Phytophthora cinnamomi]|nr:hypothetical protein ON010_g14279 [Phytophthora cinnamomi]
MSASANCWLMYRQSRPRSRSSKQTCASEPSPPSNVTQDDATVAKAGEVAAVIADVEATPGCTASAGAAGD